MTLVLELPYLPPAEFSRNARVFWTALHKAQRQVADDVLALLLESGQKPLKPYHRAAVTVTWYVPDRRNRDADGLITRTKPCLDALVTAGVIADDSMDVIGVPDYQEPVYRKGRPGTLIQVTEKKL